MTTFLILYDTFMFAYCLSMILLLCTSKQTIIKDIELNKQIN